MSYSFATSTAVNSYEAGQPAVTTPFNDEQKETFRSALASWAAVANLTFVEVPDTGPGTGGIIRATFADLDPGTSGEAYLPTSHFTGGDARFSEEFRLDGYFTISPTNRLGGKLTFIHEMGHALGFDHPDGDPDDPAYDQYDTVMSYRSGDHNMVYLTDGTSYKVRAETPMILDIQEMQILYGTNMNYHAGNDTYTFDQNTAFIKTIWDAGGTDTIDASNFARGNTVDLRPGNLSSIRVDIINIETDEWYTSDPDFYDGTNNLGIAFGAIIENAIGGNGDDILIGNDVANILTGNAGNDQLEGGLGNDTLNGGAGIDMASFRTATAGIVLALAGDGVYNTTLGSDTFISIEGLTGSAFNDTLSGNAADNFLEGGGGNDTLNGGGGNDTAIYRSATEGVTVDLAILIAQNTTGAGTDTLNNIENLIGSGYIDKLYGNAFANILYGEAGSDELDGRDGNDTLYGGLGNDAITGGLGNDQLFGDAGNDTLNGGDGDDTLDGGLGDDTLTGGAGRDRFVLSNPSSSGSGGLGAERLADFTSDFDAILEAGEDILDLSDFFSDAGITVTTANVGDFLWMNGSRMMIDRDGGGDGYYELLRLTGTSNIFDDQHLASLITAGQIIV